MTSRKLYNTKKKKKELPCCSLQGIERINYTDCSLQVNTLTARLRMIDKTCTKISEKCSEQHDWASTTLKWISWQFLAYDYTHCNREISYLFSKWDAQSSESNLWVHHDVVWLTRRVDLIRRLASCFTYEFCLFSCVCLSDCGKSQDQNQKKVRRKTHC